MGKIIEYTLVSADGVFAETDLSAFMAFRDDAYLRDGLGLLLACHAMLIGRRSYESLAGMWPGRAHPWAERLNAMPKYVFSSTLETAEWNNSTIVSGDVGAEASKLKDEIEGNLLIWGHTLLAQTLLDRRLIDVLDLSIHPLIVGHGKLLHQQGQSANLKLVATKAFANIVKLTYEPQY